MRTGGSEGTGTAEKVAEQVAEAVATSSGERGSDGGEPPMNEAPVTRSLVPTWQISYARSWQEV